MSIFFWMLQILKFWKFFEFEKVWKFQNILKFYNFFAGAQEKNIIHADFSFHKSKKEPPR